jgi:C-terminal region of eIF3h
LPQAIKLKDGFMELYKGKGAPGLTADKLKGAGIGWTDIFEEIPVSVQNSNLVCALMAQVRETESSQPCPTQAHGAVEMPVAVQAAAAGLLPGHTFCASLLGLMACEDSKQ